MAACVCTPLDGVAYKDQRSAERRPNSRHVSGLTLFRSSLFDAGTILFLLTATMRACQRALPLVFWLRV